MLHKTVIFMKLFYSTLRTRDISYIYIQTYTVKWSGMNLEQLFTQNLFHTHHHENKLYHYKPNHTSFLHENWTSKTIITNLFVASCFPPCLQMNKCCWTMGHSANIRAKTPVSSLVFRTKVNWFPFQPNLKWFRTHTPKKKKVINK